MTFPAQRLLFTPLSTHWRENGPFTAPTTLRLKGSDSHGAAWTLVMPSTTPKESGAVPVTAGGSCTPFGPFGVQVIASWQPSLRLCASLGTATPVGQE